VLVGAYAATQTDVFLTAINLRHILLAAAPLALVAMAQFNVLLVRGFDISVGSMMSLTVVLASFIVAANIGPSMLALGLAGCASMSEEECQATDWRTVGYEDGVAGYSGNRIGNYRKSCGEYGVAPDLAQYQSGREMGLREFCVPANGFRVGANGHGYNGVCPAELDRDFTQAYQSGRQLYTLRSRVIDASNELESSRQEVNQIDSSIISIGAEMLASGTTAERRAQLLLDTKQMAERKGELKSRIPQLESDLRDYERELEDYRASLSYIE